MPNPRVPKVGKDGDLNMNVDSELSEVRKSNRYNVSSGR